MPEREPISPSPSEKLAFAEAPWPIVVVGWLVAVLFGSGAKKNFVGWALWERYTRSPTVEYS